MKRLLLTTLLLSLFLSPLASEAKKDKTAKKNKNKNESVTTQAPNTVAERLKHLSADDQRIYDSLSAEQKAKIAKGQIDIGFNAWMVKMALGSPLYGTEHHPVYTDYEEVWLYSKPDVSTKVQEDKIIDPQTNWPTIHRITTTKKCNVDDFFVLWDRGVVVSINEARDHNINGTCTIEREEAYLPIVNGKPVEPK